MMNFDGAEVLAESELNLYGGGAELQFHWVFIHPMLQEVPQVEANQVQVERGRALHISRAVHDVSGYVTTTGMEHGTKR